MTSEHGQPRSSGSVRQTNPLHVAWAQLAEVAAGTQIDEEPAFLQAARVAARAVYNEVDQHRGESEEEGGWLPAATGEKPGLMNASQRLEHEHADMLHRALEIEVESERQLAAQDYNVELVQLQAAVLRDIIRLHVARADTLIYEAYFRTEGGEGG